MRSWLSVCFYGRKVQERKPIYRLLHHYNSLSNKMDKSLLAVRNINHKYIVVEKGEHGAYDNGKSVDYHSPRSQYFYYILCI